MKTASRCRARIGRCRGGSGSEADDELYQDAVRVVCEAGRASTSTLQRRLRIGYGRAAHLIDLMEKDGIVGPPDGTRPRELLKGSRLDERVRRVAARLRTVECGCRVSESVVRLRLHQSSASRRHSDQAADTKRKKLSSGPKPIGTQFTSVLKHPS